MNKNKVYLKGYVIGRAVDTLGYEGLMVQLENLDIVEIDKNLVHKEIDEPQKVTIPQFVADLIEEARTYEWDLDYLFDHIDELPGDSEISIWFYTLGNVDVLARAWPDGYTVEKERKYTVKVKATLGQYLGRYYLNNEDLTPQFTRTQFTGKEKLPTFTRKELEQTGFGWVFDCPGIEIEEVE